MAIPISEAFVEKYNKPGPRYTSYPTVPAWKQSFGEAEYREALAELKGRPDDELAIYLHLPFCAKACHYCGCNMLVTHEKDAVTGYLDRLETELALVTDLIGTGRKVVQFHWGGGTPNYLKNDAGRAGAGHVPRRLRHRARAPRSPWRSTRASARPSRRPSCARPASTASAWACRTSSRGCRRPSAAARAATRPSSVYQGCRDAGFAGVNLDLVYGLPGQTDESFSETLAGVIDLAPDRVACFSYAHVPWVRPNQEMVDTTIMLKGYEKFALFQLTVDKFRDGGYDWIGIDHFAKRDDELSLALKNRALHRNFMGYATKPAPHMLAFGMSGIGDVCDRFVQNDATYDGWSKLVDKGGLPVVKGHKLNDDDKLRRAAILNLMCNLELPWELTVADLRRPGGRAASPTAWSSCRP